MTVIIEGSLAHTTSVVTECQVIIRFSPSILLSSIEKMLVKIKSRYVVRAAPSLFLASSRSCLCLHH